MGIKLTREKKRHILLSIAYKLKKVLFLSPEKRLKLFLDLEWVFDRLAHEESFKIYAADEHPFRAQSKKFILDKISTDHQVLDLGCKYGVISDYIAKKAKKVVGIDYDSDAIKIAKETYQRENLDFEVGEAYDYLMQDNLKFDVMILSHVLEHLDDPKDFILKFKDFFQYIYIEVPDFDKHYLNQYRLDMGNSLIYSDNDHITEFDRLELRDLIKSCGMKIIDEQYRFGVQKIWCSVS